MRWAGILPSQLRPLAKPKVTEEDELVIAKSLAHYTERLRVSLSEVRRVRALASEEAWKMAALHEHDDHREVIMRATVSATLRKVWRARNQILKGKQHVGKSSTAKKAQRAAEARVD